MMWYWGGGVHWWGWLLGIVGMVAFWGLIIWAVWHFVTGLNRGSEHRQAPVEAKRILDERLARGEIDADEYQRLRDLMNAGNVAGGNGQSPVSAGDQR